LAVLDDGAARRCAECLTIPVIGTLGVLLLAKKKALLSTVKPLLDDIVKVGFRITPDVMRAVIDLAKE
jgi:predicted nucleic acid-binding protein